MKPKSALEISNENKIEKLSLGDKILNKTLKGGLPTKSGIIEIVGESAVGKSQLALQLCLMVQLPKHLGGLEGGILIMKDNFILLSLISNINHNKNFFLF